jgi:hypothetical protein
MKSRIITVVLVIAALLSVGGTSATSTTSWTYVPHSGHVVGPNEAAAVVADQTGVRTAPTGDVTFRPRRDSFRIRLDDLSPVQDAVHVVVSQPRRVRHLCVPLGRVVTIRRVDPRQNVHVSVWSETLWNPCAGRPAGGTLTITK